MFDQTELAALDIETVARLLDVTTRSINNYIKIKGLPCGGDKRSRTFNWPEVLEWWVWFKSTNGNETLGEENGDEDLSSGDGRREDIRQANLRKTKAEANLKELQLGKLRAEVISVGDAKVRLDRMMGNLRAKLLGMPPKLANRLEGERDRTGREAVLKEEMENLCREISTGAVVDLPAEPSQAAEPEEPTDASLE